MSIENALEKLMSKHEAYVRDLQQIDPSADSQILDAKLRGKVEAFKEAIKVVKEHE